MTHPLAGKILAAYIRVSSDQQDTTRQQQSIDRWTKANGLKIIQTFSDDKGKNPRDRADKRIHFQRLLKLVRADAFDAVIVDSQDRFGVKDAFEFGRYVSELREHGCELWSVAQGHLSGDDDASVISSTVGALTSTREQKEKGLRSLGKRIETVKAGRWQGGYPPFATDVVCYGSDGKEKWRLVWVGKFKRVKILSDGSEQMYEGKNVVPSHDGTDILRVQPTIHKDRIKAVRQIFQWFATENISPYQIAQRLTEAGVDPVFDQWQKMKVAGILSNPAYIGKPASNKKGAGRHWEYVDGAMSAVKAVKGRIKSSRTRKREDWILPDKPVYPPIVPVELFDKVQAKLARASQALKANGPKPKSPRVASFWLRNILYCSNCGKPLRCWNENYGDNHTYRSYFCPTYGSYGIRNPTNCGPNRVKAELAEGLIDKYLEETHQKIVRLLSRKSDDPVKPLEGDLEDKRKELVSLQSRMEDFTKRHETTDDEGDTGYTDDSGEFHKLKRPQGWGLPLLNIVTATEKGIESIRMLDQLLLYREIYGVRKPELEERRVELDTEHSTLVDRVLSLPKTAKRAIEKANARILEIEPQLEQVSAQLERIDGRFEEIVSELLNRAKAIEEIRKRVSTDAEYRRKSELVKGIIEKADCHFVLLKTKGTQRRSQFVRMEIQPQDGEALTILPDGSIPARGK